MWFSEAFFWRMGSYSWWNITITPGTYLQQNSVTILKSDSVYLEWYPSLLNLILIVEIDEVHHVIENQNQSVISLRYYCSNLEIVCRETKVAKTLKSEKVVTPYLYSLLLWVSLRFGEENFSKNCYILHTEFYRDGSTVVVTLLFHFIYLYEY